MSSSNFCLPESFKVVQGVVAIGTTATITADAVSLKNAHKAWIIVDIATPASSACALVPMQTTAVGSVGAVLASVVPIWSNLDCSATDTLVRRTAAKNYTCGASAVAKQVIFEIDPIDLTATYDCIYITIGALTVAEACSVTYLLETRYPQATPPAAITD